MMVDQRLRIMWPVIFAMPIPYYSLSFLRKGGGVCIPRPYDSLRLSKFEF